MLDRSVFRRTRPSDRRIRQSEQTLQVLLAEINEKLAELRERELMRQGEAVEAVR